MLEQRSIQISLNESTKLLFSLKKPETTQGSGRDSFEKVLAGFKNLNKVSDVDTGKAFQPVGKDFRKLFAGQDNANTKASAQGSDRTTEESRQVKGDKPGNAYLTDKSGKADKSENAVAHLYPAVLALLAEMLGARPDTLEQAIDSENTTAVGQDAREETMRIAEGLAEFAGLDEDQKLVLEDMIRSAMEKLMAQAGNANAGTIGNDGANAAAENTAGLRYRFTVRGGDTKAVFSQITSGKDQEILHLKLKIQSFAKELQADPQNSGESFIQKLEQLLQRLGITSMEESSDTAETPEGVALSQTSVIPVEDAGEGTEGSLPQAGEESAEPKADKESGSEGANEAGGIGQILQNIREDTEGMYQRTGMQEVRIPGIQDVKPADTDAAVLKTGVIRQVIERAGVIVTGDKSEMVLHLQPESLGKLSLRVVTEQGIVTARFVAESEQVKQILEANMQLLKDSLEKQGLAVQNFSVSVGQEHTNGNDQPYEPEKHLNRNAALGNGRTVNAAYEGWTGEGNVGNARFVWKDRTLDLTA